VVREGGNAVEDCYAANIQRVALHPLDQFRAFKDRREAGLGEEEIAARFMVSVAVVRQRLRLASGASAKPVNIVTRPEQAAHRQNKFGGQCFKVAVSGRKPRPRRVIILTQPAFERTEKAQ
jgi:hypothetical protein